MASNGHQGEIPEDANEREYFCALSLILFYFEGFVSCVN